MRSDLAFNVVECFSDEIKGIKCESTHVVEGVFVVFFNRWAERLLQRRAVLVRRLCKLLAQILPCHVITTTLQLNILCVHTYTLHLCIWPWQPGCRGSQAARALQPGPSPSAAATYTFDVMKSCNNQNDWTHPLWTLELNLFHVSSSVYNRLVCVDIVMVHGKPNQVNRELTWTHSNIHVCSSSRVASWSTKRMDGYSPMLLDSAA